jgi:O-antigen/teichoic acid export membrane protein
LEERTEPDQSAIDSLGRGTVVMVLGTFVFFLLSFVGRVLVARHLSPELFGDFNLGLALAGLLSLVALLGLHQAVARTIADAKDPAVRRRVIRWAAFITIGMATVSSAAVYLLASQIASLFDPAQATQLTGVFQLFSVTVGVTLLCTFIASVFQGFEDTVPNAWINQSVQPAAFVIFVSIYIAFHLQLTGALISWVISNVITLAVLLVYTWRRLSKHLPPGPLAGELPTGLWILSLALWGVTTLTYVTAYVDTLILGHYRPEEQVGIYSATMLFARLLLVGSASVTYIFLPVTARLARAGDYGTIRSSYVTTSRWVLLLTLPLCFVFVFLPNDSLRLVFGQLYLPGSEALIVITVAALMSVAIGPVNVTLAGMAKTRPLLIATAISAIANVVLSLTLTPVYGLMGAAIAWSVARVLYPATGALALYTDHRITPFRRSLVLPLVVSLAVGIPVFLLVGFFPHPDWIIFPMFVFGVALFLGAILFTRSIEAGDLIVVRITERLLGRPLPGLERFMLRFAQPGTIAASR